MKLLSSVISGAFLALPAQVCTCFQTPKPEIEMRSNVSQQKPEGSLHSETVADSFNRADQRGNSVFILKERAESGGQGIADEAYSEDMDYEGSAIGYVENKSSFDASYKSVLSKERAARKSVLRSLGYLVAVVMGSLSMILIVVGQPAFALVRGEYDAPDEILDHITHSQFFAATAVLLLGFLTLSAVLIGSFIRVVLWVVRLGNCVYAATRKTDEPRQHQNPEATSDVTPHGGAAGGATGPVQR